MKKILRDHSPDASRTVDRDDEFRLFDLDKNRLDEEWVGHVKMYARFAMELVEARDRFERAKAERDLVNAEMDRDIRADPPKYGMEKAQPKEAVEAVVTTSKKFQRANTAVLDAKHEMEVLQVRIDVMDHRKKGLENLVQLRLADYFSEPRAPKESEDIKARTAFKRNKR